MNIINSIYITFRNDIKEIGDDIKVAKISGDVEEGALFRYSLIVPALNETFSVKI